MAHALDDPACGAIAGRPFEGLRPLLSRAVARLAAVFARDVVRVLFELTKLGRVVAAEGLLGAWRCQMHRPGGDVDTAAGKDAPDAKTLAALHAPVVRENAVGRHGVERRRARRAALGLARPTNGLSHEQRTVQRHAWASGRFSWPPVSA